MTNPQQFGQQVQDQTMDAVRKTQDAVVDSIAAWTETTNKATAKLPSFVKSFEFPGFAEFNKHFPTATETIESNFDFAQKILANQRDFVQRVVAATKTAE